MQSSRVGISGTAKALVDDTRPAESLMDDVGALDTASPEGLDRICALNEHLVALKGPTLGLLADAEGLNLENIKLS